MKKILTVFVLFSLWSCDIGDDVTQNFQSELMPIESVNIPSEFIFGETHEITVFYSRPNGCYTFERFINQPEANNTRIVAVVDTNYFNDNCTQAIVDAEVSFNFTATSLETYTFQFFQGTSSTGEDQYLIVEVPVVE